MPVGVTPFGDTIVDNYNAYPKSGIVAPSAARTTLQNFGDASCVGAGGLIVVVEITAFTAGSITVTINGVTPTGTLYPILVSAALAATGVTRLQISPSLTAVANLKANDLLPDVIRITVGVGGAQSITYSISAVLAPA